METHQHLKKGLLPRHVQFLALAGMIGTGIFKGSSDSLNMAGPSVVIAYLIGGAIVIHCNGRIRGDGNRFSEYERTTSH